jgi:hypothetical protein
VIQLRSLALVLVLLVLVVANAKADSIGRVAETELFRVDAGSFDWLDLPSLAVIPEAYALDEVASHLHGHTPWSPSKN